MSEQTGRAAHKILCERYSNIPAWEDLSERTKIALGKTGECYDQLDELQKQSDLVDAQLCQNAMDVETFLTEELGSLQFQQADQFSMLKKMLGLESDPTLDILDAEFEDVDDDEPTIH